MLKFIKDFNPLIGKRKASFFIIIILSFLPLSQDVYPGNEKNPAIVTVVVAQINGEASSEGIEELIPIKEGEPVSLKKINNAIKQIYRSGLFSDVQVLKQGEERVRLTFLLTKKIFINKINIESNGEASFSKFKKELYSLHEGDAFSEDKIRKAVEELKEKLSREGYFQPQIQTSVQTDSKTSQMDILFVIQSIKRFEVGQIYFTGNVLLPEFWLKEEMATRKGKEFIPSVLEKDIDRIKEFYRSLGYQRAEVKVNEESFDEREGTVVLGLKIDPGEKIEIEVKGAEIPLDLLKPIWEARIFEEWGLDEGEAKIINYLRKRNYIFASVISSIEKDENRIRVIHNVSPGEKYKTQDISFDGLEYFTQSQIKDELLISENFLFIREIDGSRLFELPREIEFLYKINGFSDTRVELNFKITGNAVRPVYFIDEGKQEVIESISVEGSGLFSQERLLGELSSFQGGPFFQPSIQKDIEKLENFYLNQGVRGTKVRAGIQRNGDDLFSVTFRINEGKKVKIENIIITGNEVTRKGIILRELLVKENDYALYESIRETKRRLERLGVFTEVKIEEILISPDKENLLINLKEGERNYASLGMGMETMNEPRSFAVWNNAIRPRGTAEFIRSNIFGSAAQVSVVGQISKKERRGVISWEQPYLFGFPLQSFLNGWWEREERRSYTFERQGLSFSTIKSLSEKENMIFVGTLRMARTTLLELYISESEVDRQHFPFSATSVSGSFIWERRDDPFNPVKGHFLSTTLEWAYPVFNAESDYLRIFSKYQHYVPVFPSITFSSTVRLGLGKGRMPIHERFFGGGSNSFRGVEFDELGPKDPNFFSPIGGKALLLFNFELAFPFLTRFENLLASVFYDKGNVYSKRRQVSWGSLQDAVGFGLRYRTPLGPVRFELSWNLDAPKGERAPLLFITIGNVF